MNNNFISDSFAFVDGDSDLTRVRVKSQTERISLFGIKAFSIIISLFLLVFNILNFYLKNHFDLLRFEPAPVYLTNTFDRSATSIPLWVWGKAKRLLWS